MKRALSILLLVALLIPTGNVAFFSEGAVKVPQSVSVSATNSVEVSAKLASSESLAGDLYFSEARSMTKASGGGDGFFDRISAKITLENSCVKLGQDAVNAAVAGVGVMVLVAIFAFAGWLKGLIFG